MSDKKKNIAILQLSRFGDLIQTTIAAKQFKINHSGFNLTIICRKKFGIPLRKILDETFDEIDKFFRVR